MKVIDYLNYPCSIYDLRIMIGHRILGSLYHEHKNKWKLKDKNSFMDLVFLGLPLPNLYFKQTVDNSLFIVDGNKIIDCLMSFYNDEFTLEGMTDETINGLKYSELPTEYKAWLDKRRMNTIYFKPSLSDEIVFMLNKKLNK